jgi:hypothetical protein
MGISNENLNKSTQIPDSIAEVPAKTSQKRGTCAPLATHGELPFKVVYHESVGSHSGSIFNKRFAPLSRKKEV